MSVISKLQIVLEANTTAFDRNLAKVNDTLAKFSKSTGEMHKKMDKFARVHRDALQGLQSAGQAAAVGLGATAYGIKGAVDEAVKFESAMAKVNKVMDFKTPEALQNMRKELEKLSATGTSTFVELAQIAEAGGQLGVLEKDLVPFVSMVSDMATAFDMSADVAGEAMAKLANVWNKPIQEMSQFGDMVNTVSNNTPAKASQIVEALGRIGGTAKSFGLSEQGAVSLTSAMIGLGKAPEVASKAVNHLVSTLATMDMADKNTSASLKQLGLDASEFGKLLKTDAEGALFSFLEAMNKLPKDEQIGFGVDVFGKNFYDDILALATAPELLTKIRDLLADSANYTGSMTKEAEVLSATTEGQIKKFQNNITILKASIGTAFLPALTSVMDKLTPIIGAISAWANENPKLLTTITAITAGALTLVATLGGLALAFTAVTSGIGSVIAMGKMVAVIVAPIINLLGFVKMFGSALAMLGFPVTAAVAGITALIAVSVLLYQNWDTVKAKASELWQALPQMANDAWLAVQSAWSGVVAWFGGVWDSIKQSFMAWLDGMPKPVQQMVANIGTIFSTLVSVAQTVWDSIVAAAKWVSDGIVSAWQGLVGMVSAIWGEIKSVVTAVIDSLTPIAKAGFEIFSSVAKVQFTAIKTVVGVVFEAIKAFLSAWVNSAKAIFTAGLTVFASVFNAGFALIKNIFTTTFAIIKALVSGDMDGVKQAISDGMKNAWHIVKSGVINIVGAFKNLGSQLMQAGQDAIQGFINGVKARMGEVRGTARDMANRVASTVKSALDIHSPSRVMKKLGIHTADGLAKGIQKGTPKAVKSAKKMADDIKKAVADSVANLKREIALFGDDSPITALKYDIGMGKYQGASTAELVVLTAQKYALERNKMAYDEIANIKKDIATHGMNALQILDWEIGNTKKYQDVSADVLDSLKEQTAQKMAQLDLQEKLNNAMQANERSAQNHANLQKQIALFDNQSQLAKFDYDWANGAFDGADNILLLRERSAIAELERLQQQQKAKTAFTQMQDGLAGELSPLAKLQKQLDERLHIIKDFENTHTNVELEAQQARQQAEESYLTAKKDLMLTTYEQGLGAVNDLIKSAFGEQSRLYRAMFAIEKGMALSRVLLQNKVALANAWASAPFPKNLPIVAKTVIETGVLSGAISAIKPVIGQAHDGIMSVPKSGTWNLEKGERVLPRHTAKALDDKLDKIGNGGRPVNVVINNYSGEKTDVQQMPNGDMMVTIGKMISHTVDAKLNQRFIQARRQGGELYGR